MYETTVELAENKLLLLYIIKSIKYPISNTQLTEIVLENNFINYFTLQQYISELITSEFLKYEEKDSKQFIILTNKGDKVLSLFKDRISQNRLSLLDEYLGSKIEKIKKELSIYADYMPDNNNSFLVNLKATENDAIIIDINISVADKTQASFICSKWKDNSSAIYTKIINALIED